jgi:hypothetical protein
MTWKLPGLGALAAAAAVAVVLAVPAGAAAPTAIYDNVPSPLPGNVPSIAYEANGIAQFGDRVAFSTGSSRNLTTVDVVMSSWACQSGHWTTGDCVSAPGATFAQSITLTIYAVGAGNQPGAALGTVTQTFAIPYRPSADPVNCAGANAGKWFDGTGCFNGKAATVTFDLSALHVVPADEVIFGIAYNTTHYGSAPVGEAAPCFGTPAGCPYDSLNVGTADAVTVGTNPAPADAYLDASYGSCAGGAIHPFSLDAGCWAGFKPAVRFNAAPALVGPPTNKDQCKNGGWKTFNNPSFKNQGECVSYVEDHKQNHDDDDDHGDHGGGHGNGGHGRGGRDG